jgi:hypothetical protein
MLIRLIIGPADEHRSGANQMRQHLSFQEHFRRGNAILGETSGGRKTTQSTLKVLPELVIYDVDLTLTLPPALSATSGMNAIAHAVEAMYAKDKNPIISLMGSLAIGSQRCASYGHYRSLGTARPAMNLGLSYLLGATSHSDPDHPNEQVVSKLNWVQPASIGKSSKSRN